ncbi:mitochondrial import inner membrane translocase subunit Tim21-like [Oppia nitens]|uniref:mitochondrial import inner membrane translocase subunit Tim21-like n=1 Tax=Oppia nitens TaxID=1686743 RepID=UPI0023DA0BB8|nr:mitochondrial import inner membrane translocase subunit Tim21-like [Oppia nitens]
MSNVLRVQSKVLSNICAKHSNKCLFRVNISFIQNINKFKFNFISYRCLSSNHKSNKSSLLSERPNNLQSELTIGEKVKQTTQDITSIGVIIAGIGVTAFIFWAIFRELFSSASPSGLYSSALKLCKNDTRVTEAIGEPIKGFGEMSSRGRRRHVSAVEYEKDGQTVIRVKFYLKGPKASGTVHLEAFKKKSNSQFRYLFVELDHSRQVIVLEDNRLIEDKPIFTAHQ